MNKKYKFVGDGLGVPGLPHEVTDDEAADLGVSELLQDAVKNGSYVEVNPSPSPSPKGEGNKKKNEVNDG